MEKMNKRILKEIEMPTEDLIAKHNREDYITAIIFGVAIVIVGKTQPWINIFACISWGGLLIGSGLLFLMIDWLYKKEKRNGISNI